MKQVAFLVPTCSYNLPDSPVHEQHLVKIFIKSLLSYTPDFDIRIFIGYNDDDKVYCNKDFTPYLDLVLGAFGTDRIMFGSDWPVCLLAGKYEEVKGVVDDYFQGFSDNEKSKIYGDNAAAFYGIV